MVAFSHHPGCKWVSPSVAHGISLTGQLVGQLFGYSNLLVSWLVVYFVGLITLMMMMMMMMMVMINCF